MLREITRRGSSLRAPDEHLEPAGTRELGRVLGLSKSAASRSVKRLSEDRYIEYENGAWHRLAKSIPEAPAEYTEPVAPPNHPAFYGRPRMGYVHAMLTDVPQTERQLRTRLEAIEGKKLNSHAVPRALGMLASDELAIEKDDGWVLGPYTPDDVFDRAERAAEQKARTPGIREAGALRRKKAREKRINENRPPVSAYEFESKPAPKPPRPHDVVEGWVFGDED